MSGTDELIRGLAERMAKRFCNVIMLPTNYIETSESWLRECGLAEVLKRAEGHSCVCNDTRYCTLRISMAALRSKVVGQ